MSTLESKNVILQSLSEMDKKQTDKVLEYINLIISSSGENSYANFKKKAMTQINRALQEV